VGAGEYTGAAATADYIIQPNSSSAYGKPASMLEWKEISD